MINENKELVRKIYEAIGNKNYNAFNNYKMPIKQLIAEGDLVAAYMEFTGAYTGKYLAIETTNKKVHFVNSMMI